VNTDSARGSSIGVVLADRHAPIRAGVRLALESTGFTILAEVADAGAAIAEAERHKPELVLLDLYLPGDGLAATRLIHERVPETTIVILTTSPSDEDRFAALVAGASGYLLKDTSARQLPIELRGILAGDAGLPRTLEKRLIDEFRALKASNSTRFRRPQPTGPRADLTSREWEVLEFIAEGLPTPAVAQQLGIAEVTVRRHISSAVHKLGATDRSSAVQRLSEGSAGHRPKQGT
jgi:DNA-binding NarL/FixJ family response regulator